MKGLDGGFAWFDCGTHSSLLEASKFVEAIEERQSNMIACLEEIALTKGWLSTDSVGRIASTKYAKTDYGRYLNELIQK